MPNDSLDLIEGRHQPLRLSMALSAITFGQLASSFGIQWYTVTQLGAGAETDGLYAALTLPQIVMVVLIDPVGFVLTPLLSIKNERERRIVGAQMVWFIAGCSLLITLLAVIVAPWTVPLLAPGFSELTVQLAVDLARIQATAIVGAACTMALSSLYHAGQNFIRPAASMLIWSLVGWIILIVGIRSGGVILAAWVQVITFVGPLFFLASPVAWWPWREHGRLRDFLSEVWRQSKPLMVSASYCRTGFMVDRLLTSLLAPGSIVILELASRVHFAIVRILNQGVTTPIVPVLASLSNHGNWPVFRARYWDRLIWIVLVSFGMVLGLATVAILGPYFYHAGGEHSMMGTLRWEELNKLTVALVIGSGVLMFGSINHLAMSAFYAQGDTRTPMRIQVLAHSLGIILKACGFFLGGLYGIMAAMSVAYGVEAAVLGVALNRRLSLRLRVDQQAPLELSTAGAPPRSP